MNQSSDLADGSKVCTTKTGAAVVDTAANTASEHIGIACTAGADAAMHCREDDVYGLFDYLDLLDYLHCLRCDVSPTLVITAGSTPDRSSMCHWSWVQDLQGYALMNTLSSPQGGRCSLAGQHRRSFESSGKVTKHRQS